MKRVILCTIALIGLSGCALPPAAIAVLGLSGGVGASALVADAVVIKSDIDKTLSFDAPLKRDLCAARPPTSAGGIAWCANIPVDSAGLIKQYVAVVEAVNK